MSSSRADRMPERIKEIVAELVGTLKDPRIGFVTVTDVRTSADLSHATVYYTVLASPSDAGDEPGGRAERTGEATLGDDRADDVARERTAEGLRSATPLLRRELGRRLRIRQTPALEFVDDPVPARGRRIEALLDEARRRR